MANEMKITITGDASSAMAVLDQFQAKMFASVDEMTGGFGKLAAGIGGVAGIAGALAGKVMEGFKAVGEFAPEASAQVNELARTFEGLQFQTGEGLHNLNVFDATMKLTGGTIEQLSGWLTGVTRAMKSNSEVFIANGVAASQAALMHMQPIEVMRGALAVIEGETDQTKRLILAQEMLGRGAIEELPQMRRFFENIGEGTEALEKYGIAIDDSGIERMKRMEKEAGLLNIQMDALKRGVAENYEPWDKFFAMMNSNLLKFASYALQAVNGAGSVLKFIMDPTEAINEMMAKEGAGILAKSPEGQREQMRGVGHAGDGQHAQTKEEIEAAKAAAKKAQEESRKAAAAAAREKKEDLEVNNNLQEQTNRLNAEDIKTIGASTIALKKERDEKEALAKLNEEYHKIDLELAKSPTAANQAQAQEANIAAHKAYMDRMLQIKRESDAAQLAEDAATKDALDAANKKALEDLRKSLAQQSEIQGKMTRGEIEEKLKAETAKGGPQAHAALQYMVEAHWNGTAAGGALAGMHDFVAQGDNLFNSFRSTTLQAMTGIQDGVAHSIEGILEHTESGAQAMKAFGKSVETSVIGALAKMAAQYLMTAAACAAFSTASMAGAMLQETAAESLATAEIWAAWAPLSLVGGEAAALAEIAIMTGSIAAASKVASGTGGKFATGGLIDTPTLALMGEAGPELVAPEHDFKDWANAHQNLGYNLASHANQVSRLGAQAGSYGRAGLAQNGGAMPSHVAIDARGAIFASTTEGQRAIDKMVNSSNQRIGRATG